MQIRSNNENQNFYIHFTIISLKSFAFSCLYNNLAQEYIDADFGIIVTVKNTYDTKENDFKRSTYVAELEFEKIYKGSKFGNLHMFGTASINQDDDRYFGSCDLFIQKGERYIIILKKIKW